MRFEEDDKNTSSTYRELLAVKYILQSVGHQLRNQAVQWFSDNVNVCRIIEVGSRKPNLHEIAIDIFDLCINYDIKLLPSWIPRTENFIADSLSKFNDSDNWSIDNKTFEHIQNTFGCFTIDRFSDDINKKVKVFNSKFHCPNTVGVNAFTLDWKNEFNWLSPPIKLVGKTLRHAKYCKAKRVLFIPMWKSSYFWPLITPDGKHFEKFVKMFLLLDPFFFNYSEQQNVFDGFTNFNSLALLIDFSE